MRCMNNIHESPQGTPRTGSDQTQKWPQRLTIGSMKAGMGFVLLLCITHLSLAQDHPNTFRNPMEGPLDLSGNFGELRTNHFHAGLDIRTEGKTGLPVHASEGGYVSRIDVSPHGFGKALYITHPNGYTTVYAHLSGFIKKIRKFLRKVQYEQERFAVNVKPNRYKFPVEPGEQVAYSGNSGSSGGPHLHFEIRDTDSEEPLNPMHFGLQPLDRIPPHIRGLRIFPFGEEARIDGKSSTAGYYVNGSNGQYQLRGHPDIRIHGKVGFAIRTDDRIDGSRFSFGIYSITLFQNGEPIYKQRMDRLDYDKSRYMNAHTDYLMHEKYDKPYHRSHRLPNQKLPIYEDLRNEGYITFKADTVHRFTYHIKDLSGNTSKLSFKVRGVNAEGRKEQEAPPSSGEVVAQFPYDQANAFEKAGLSVRMPKNTLYQDTKLTLAKKDTPSHCIAPRYTLNDRFTPVHKEYELKIRTGELPQRLHTKATLVAFENGHRVAQGGRYEDGWVKGSVQSFGDFSVAFDTIPPEIQPINIADGRDLGWQQTIRIGVQDELSEIAEYNAYIDGRWVMMEYDAKNSSLTFSFQDIDLEDGDHLFQLRVRDEHYNTALYEASFTR